MWSDPIADLLTRIRNAARIRAKEVRAPKSRLGLNICQVLKAEGYLGDVDTIDDGKQGLLRIQMKYGPHGEQIFNSLRRVSTPGRRVYRAVGKLPRVQNGMGVAVVSTNRGVLSDRQCRSQRVGGEVICTIV
ncbi:MAG: 30S ribosomal protein S8 [Phycisphaerae bacterium]